MSGVHWGGEQPGDAAVSIALAAFQGAVPFGQFFEVTADYYGLEIQLQP